MAKVNAADVGRAGCRYLGRLYSEMDCQKFVETALNTAGIRKDLSGSNAWFREMTWTGTPAECKAKFGSIPAGAFLFILSQNGKEPEKYRKDGKGNAEHIGIYTGMTGRQMVQIAEEAGVENAAKYNFGDGAIHSSESKEHVCTSKFAGKEIRGGWNRIGLWNKLSYGETIDRMLGGEDGGSRDEDPGKDEEQILGTGTVFAPKGTTVKMRARPSMGCDLYWEVPIGSMVDILQTGDWDRIRWEGRTGYMKAEYVRKGMTMDEIQPDDPQILQAVVTADSDYVKMRQKPSRSCRLYDEVPVGATVTVLERGDPWSRISYGFRDGWYMMTDYLKFEEDDQNGSEKGVG